MSNEIIEYLDEKEKKIFLEGISELISSIKEKEIGKRGLKEIDQQKLSASKIKIKYRKVIDDSFTLATKNYDKLFDVAKIIITEYNITPEGFVMCLNNENKLKLKNYADNHYCTEYYKQKEKERFIRRRDKKGKKTEELDEISKFFK